MLTRDLLRLRTVKGKLRPTFVSSEDPALLALATALVEQVAAGVGRARDDVDDALAACAGAHPQPKVAKGLVKLLSDRMEVEDAGPEIAAARQAHFQRAAQVLRALPPDATVELYEARLRERLAEVGTLEAVRDGLYADLPGNRRLSGWEALAPAALIDRYNLALAQGPLLGARRLTLHAPAPELLRVRKVLRWLKFCRLVAELHREGDDWRLEVEGPGALLSLQKRYGLQLATFLTIVPVLERWSLEAEVEHGRRKGTTLVLDHRDPLVSPHPAALGHIPAEVETLAQGFPEDDAEWALDLTPTPRQVGAAGLCVPDLLFRHRRSGREVALELFHAWHAGALQRRLAQLRSRPDPALLLGVDRALTKGEGERAALEEHPQVMLFHGFPSAKRLRERLGRLEVDGAD